ncbi:hypothetical protein D8M04_09235 [Oceanobacillus piezotolerans]|uniref:YppF-like protein n=1 Tax=Oceanobacillus piezotolerans TaxID=2448030 RepID=A0A498D6H4_9BACI|nr:YppF family protein [Oceanobacillus piezotolerans]RLL45046.1 hypothetical protein D8M04_09235 [Oceanobacillus piezotolerans]
MHIHDLVDTFISERHYSPDTINNLLDYYQQKYITGKIEPNDYRNIFAYLHKQGATSAYETQQYYQKSY